MRTPQPPLNAERLWARVEALSKMTMPDIPWTRRAFSPLFLQSRDWLRQQFLDAGMAVHLDAGGNLVGRLAARREGAQAKPIATGSHCDTVMMGGRFDGIIGVLAGIEVAHTLHEYGIALAHPFEVIDFLSEEPSDYGISCIGSRALSGQLPSDMLRATNPDGETLAQGLRRIGGNPDALGQALRAPDSTAAFVELHIEQGPVLETRGLPIGVVTNIVGIQRVSIVVEGQPDHAGTTPMDIRRDALVGAAGVIEAVHQRASALTGRPHYVVATIGRLTLTPNASNAVPGRVEMMMEVRSESAEVLDSFAREVMAAVEAPLRELRVAAHVTPVSRSKPTDCAPWVMDTIERAAGTLGYRSMRLPSGAGHDAVYMAPTGPIGMIFIPCLGGRSHCPQEWIEPAQLLDGTRVLYQTVLDLDRKLAAG
ncbi:Zn-dependent hydrolase [Pseudorhodoferax sp. Leaf274]|uniref:Zn-dependent hydrolase n=1 Tax=Pseudorhodoferax sp. Leaf274 TaxID=1736318 RepID=UPI000703B92D|nr:Zn-dependent hydrolase [Pseudorhodoferax sp. Leaf274]KQP35790.1 Zn-dependent hydrolase [Pseudorhodoferax sp. Leaf274]